MIITNTINADDTTTSSQDTVFTPLYIKKDTTAINKDVDSNTTCKQYIFSILKDREFNQQYRQTIFQEKTTYSPNMQMLNKEHVINSDWIFGIFFFIIFLSAIIIRFAGNIIFSFIRGCFSTTSIASNTKNGTTIHLLSFIPTIFIFLPLVSLSVFCTITHFNLLHNIIGFPIHLDIIQKSPFLLWFSLYICSIFIYFSKILLIKFFSWVFKANKISNYYVQTMLNFASLMGFCLFLPTIFAIYLPVFYKEIYFFFILLVFILLSVTRILRCFFVIINTFKFSHVYLFFYLCTVEILPLIVILKLLFF